MTLFWLLAAAITAATAALLIHPLRRPPAPPPPRTEWDLALYRDQLAEIERDLARGALAGQPPFRVDPYAQPAARLLPDHGRELLGPDLIGMLPGAPVSQPQFLCGARSRGSAAPQGQPKAHAESQHPETPPRSPH